MEIKEATTQSKFQFQGHQIDHQCRKTFFLDYGERYIVCISDPRLRVQSAQQCIRCHQQALVFVLQFGHTKCNTRNDTNAYRSIFFSKFIEQKLIQMFAYKTILLFDTEQYFDCLEPTATMMSG